MIAPTSVVLPIDYIRPADASWASGSFTEKNFHVHDLTQMFGSQVADYLYSIEQATTGAGVALFRALVSAQDNSYETGELVSTTYEAVNALTYNFINPSILVNGKWIKANDGQEDDNASRKATLEYIPCSPSTAYYFGTYSSGASAGNEYAIDVAFYTASRTYISGVHQNLNHSTTTSPSNAAYMRIGIADNTLDAMVKVSDSNDGIWKAYGTLDSLSLPTPVTLRGILKVVNNALVVDGDEYDPETGEIERNYDFVDLGTLSYFANGTSETGVYRMMTTGLQGLIKPPASNNEVADIRCPQYLSITAGNTWSKVLGIGVDTGGSLAIYDPNYNNNLTSPSDIKTALSGVILVYKKATPTSDPNPVTPINDPTLSTEGGGTLSTTQTNDPAIVSAMQISYLTL